MNLVAGCVMKVSMVFCQKNILEPSMSFHGDYIKEMPTNKRGQSDIVTHSTNIWSKVYSFQRGFILSKRLVILSYVIENTLAPNDSNKRSSKVFSFLFQILVLLDTISDWPWWVSWQHFYSRSLPTENPLATVSTSLKASRTLKYSFLCQPSKEQVHEERVEVIRFKSMT